MNSPHHPRLPPVLIGIDWGSSNLRVALLNGHGTVLARRESADGVFNIKDHAFGSALRLLCGDWLDEHHVPLFACGMIGSRQGVIEAPYVACPVPLSDLAQGLCQVALPGSLGATEPAGLNLYIVPGLKTGSDASGWDVLRGEETLMVGIDGAPGSLHVLPGTHSKWITVGAGGRIENFQTYMTGELFEILSTSSSLSRVMAKREWTPAAFQQGVDEAQSDDLANLLFRVRTAGLMSRFAPCALPDYLSGMLIGAEVKAALARFPDRDPTQSISVVASAQLVKLYGMAMDCFGLNWRAIADNSVFRGLLTVARLAGLVQTTSAHD